MRRRCRPTCLYLFIPSFLLPFFPCFLIHSLSLTYVDCPNQTSDHHFHLSLFRTPSYSLTLPCTSPPPPLLSPPLTLPRSYLFLPTLLRFDKWSAVVGCFLYFLVSTIVSFFSFAPPFFHLNSSPLPYTPTFGSFFLFDYLTTSSFLFPSPS